MAIVDNDYPLWDRWFLGADRYHAVPHGTPRHAPVKGKSLGALDFHIARLDGKDVRSMLLRDWMLRESPKPYRALWTIE